MRMKNHDELDLIGDNNETITVAVTANGAVVNFVLNGQAWPGGSFVLDRNVAPVFKLLAQTTYQGASGGHCQIRISGSNDGDVSVHDEVQAQGEAFDAVVYKFTIV